MGVGLILTYMMAGIHVVFIISWGDAQINLSIIDPLDWYACEHLDKQSGKKVESNICRKIIFLYTKSGWVIKLAESTLSTRTCTITKLFICWCFFSLHENFLSHKLHSHATHLTFLLGNKKRKRKAPHIKFSQFSLPTLHHFLSSRRRQQRSLLQK